MILRENCTHYDTLYGPSWLSLLCIQRHNSPYLGSFHQDRLAFADQVIVESSLIGRLPDHNILCWVKHTQDYLYILYFWTQAQLFSSISDASNVGRNQMDGTGLSYKEQEQGSSLIEKGYDFYKDIQFIEGQPNKKSGLNHSQIKINDNFRIISIKFQSIYCLNDLLNPTS